jgi:hypothetical protein
MGLDLTDTVPNDLTLSQAYESIRRWYSQSIRLLWKQKEISDEDVRAMVLLGVYDRIRATGEESRTKSEALILALAPADQLSELEIRAVLGEVIYGNLEWAYHQSDGQYKMAAYAKGALATAGLDWRLTEEERQQLEASKLWPFLSINR